MVLVLKHLWLKKEHRYKGMNMLKKEKTVNILCAGMLIFNLSMVVAAYANDAASLQNTQTPGELFDQPTVSEKAAFNNMLKQSMPMTPDQIVQLHKMLDVTQKAAAAPANTPPVPEITTRRVSLAPGALPPVIRLGQGFVSSVVFIDSTGQAWPIAGYDVGNSQAFNIQPPQKGGNTLMIQAMTPYTYGNMSITLQGLSTPIIVTLVPGQKAIDYRADLHIDQPGPNALEIPGGDGLPAPAGDVLLTVLNGITPPGSKLLSASDSNTQAWMQGSQMFLRTKLIVMSPAWVSMMRSSDGTIAYKMPKTSRVVVSDAGRLTTLKIEGLE